MLDSLKKSVDSTTCGSTDNINPGPILMNNGVVLVGNATQCNPVSLTPGVES